MGNNTSIDAVEILMAEHEVGLAQLSEMQKAIENIEKNGFTNEDVEKIKTAINFINDEIRLHNEKEEVFLFPILAKYVNGPTFVMEHEHRTLWDAFTKLKLLMDKTELKDFEGNKENIINTALYIIELLSAHIYKENNILFPMAKNSLSIEEYTSCSEKIFKATELKNNNI